MSLVINILALWARWWHRDNLQSCNLVHSSGPRCWIWPNTQPWLHVRIHFRSNHICWCDLAHGVTSSDLQDHARGLEVWQQWCGSNVTCQGFGTLSLLPYHHISRPMGNPGKQVARPHKPEIEYHWPMTIVYTKDDKTFQRESPRSRRIYTRVYASHIFKQYETYFVTEFKNICTSTNTSISDIGKLYLASKLLTLSALMKTCFWLNYSINIF